MAEHSPRAGELARHHTSPGALHLPWAPLWEQQVKDSMGHTSCRGHLLDLQLPFPLRADAAPSAPIT